MIRRSVRHRYNALGPRTRTAIGVILALMFLGPLAVRLVLRALGSSF